MANDFETLDKEYSGKNVSIKINAQILSNKEFLENAAKGALERMAEAIKFDVVSAKRDAFADKPGVWGYPNQGYSNSDEYYSSGNVPYWRGGLIGSFELIGSGTDISYLLAFTAPYALLIEKGGNTQTQPPENWFSDKGVISYPVKEVQPHPYMDSVVFKIQSNLEEFGYLDVFILSFSNFFR